MEAASVSAPVLEKRIGMHFDFASDLGFRVAGHGREAEASSTKRNDPNQYSGVS
jgi:hypothetical protein